MPPTSAFDGGPEAWILSIGNELLIGRIVNTNASWLAKMLSVLGFNVRRIITVPDELDDIVEELRRAIGRARVVITTGGLGPTYDDRTLEAVGAATNRPLAVDDAAREMVERFYSQKGLPMTPERLKMAMLPAGSKPLPNPVGAAPGVALEHEGTLIVSLPGVPAEMQAIFTEYVVPLLRRIAPERHLAECSVLVSGVPESELAPVLARLAKENPSAYIKSHPKGHEIRGPILDVRVLVGDSDPARASEKAARLADLIAEEAARLGGSLRSKSCGSPD